MSTDIYEKVPREIDKGFWKGWKPAYKKQTVFLQSGNRGAV